MRWNTGMQLGLVESSVVVDPASHDMVDVLCEALKVECAALFQLPGPYLFTNRFLCVAADRWIEADEVSALAVCHEPWPERVP